MTHARELPPSRRVLGLVAGAALVGGLLTSGCGSGNGRAAGSTTTAASRDASEQSTTTTATDVSEPSAESDKASGAACDIVSDDVAARVLGVEIVRREGHGEPGSPSVSCIKGKARAVDPSDFFYVSTSVVTGGVALVDESAAEQGSQSVAGLGDRAVYLPSAGALFIADGGDAVQVQVVKAGVPGSQADCVTVAKDVLERRG